ncbi:MAG: hypothetical protein O9270_11785 [Aquidulcibacter sp.]|jgi:hypothetical protein|uniref:hypothetical protein n=1 Tax=Aquidulcibacter sp. TaxID=2052990 RepID=UPI0022C455EA|nr:hypothetical protein [Aquidulcibacter sp.]MCE2892518.1 hypothetical protein [Hyphomonadaceae bacterium]MCZ8208858.1 hypothetical protein [Aquidulcibacter sp.]
MKTLPLILAAGHLCLGLALAGPVFAAVPQTKATSQQAVAPLKPEQMAWAKDLAHPNSRHTLCQAEGRQAFSAKTCAILSQLAPQPTTEGQVIDVKTLKANRALWLSLPMSVRDRLETYDMLVIASAKAPNQPTLAR